VDILTLLGLICAFRVALDSLQRWTLNSRNKERFALACDKSSEREKTAGNL